MSKRINRNGHQRINLSTILQRLPLHRQLNESQTSIISFSTVWQRWSKTNLATEHSATTHLSNFQNGVLSIHCGSSTCASQLKHQQTSLLNTFHQEGFNEIQQILIRIEHPTNQSTAKINDTKKNASINSLEPSLKPEKPKPSAASIKSIENCQKMTSNDQLSESLARLADTLKRPPK